MVTQLKTITQRVRENRIRRSEPKMGEIFQKLNGRGKTLSMKCQDGVKWHQAATLTYSQTERSVWTQTGTAQPDFVTLSKPLTTCCKAVVYF